MAEMQSLLTQLEEFGTKTVRLGATHRFRRTGSDVGNAPVAGGTTRLAKVDDHSNELEPNKPSLDVVLSKSPARRAPLCCSRALRYGTLVVVCHCIVLMPWLLCQSILLIAVSKIRYIG